MNAQDIVHRMPEAFDSGAAGDLEVIAQCEFSEPVYLVVKAGQCHTYAGSAARPDITLSIDDADFIALMRGELNAMNAFMTGRLRLDGDLVLAQRLVSLFDISKL